MLSVPPDVEQLEIVNFISLNNKIFDDMTMKAIQAVELFKERRTALISAAVTGKIDVRDWQPATNPVFEDAAA